MFGRGLTTGSRGLRLGLDPEFQKKWKTYLTEKGVFRVELGETVEIHGVKNGTHDRFYRYDMDAEKAIKAINDSMGHAEVQLLLRIVDGINSNGGTMPKNLLIFVDRTPCWACAWVLRRLKKHFGIENIRLVFIPRPSSTTNGLNYFDL